MRVATHISVVLVPKISNIKKIRIDDVVGKDWQPGNVRWNRHTFEIVPNRSGNGYRAAFVCPRCGRKARVMYLASELTNACRLCMRLRYDLPTMSKFGRYWAQKEAIESKIEELQDRLEAMRKKFLLKPSKRV